LILIVLFAIAGVAAGLAVDAAVARLAREPFERPRDFAHEAESGAEAAPEQAEPKPLPLALTSRAWIRRIVVMAVTAALFAAAAARYDGHGVATAVVAAYMAVLVGCAATDAISFRVPNAFTYPAIVFALVVGMVAPGANREATLAGGFGLGFGFLVLAILTRGGLGMGDVKMAVFAGFALGLLFGLVAMFVTALSGGLIATVLLVTRIRGRRDPIPYGPFIALGVAYVLLSQGTSFLEL
jgi:prepilin signal peptidase PulO-like enzyme (type II secretory pathway)